MKTLNKSCKRTSILKGSDTTKSMSLMHIVEAHKLGDIPTIIPLVSSTIIYRLFNRRVLLNSCAQLINLYAGGHSF